MWPGLDGTHREALALRVRFGFRAWLRVEDVARAGLYILLFERLIAMCRLCAGVIRICKV